MDKLNQWLSLTANVGVLIGIFFLAFEIQQNTQMMRAQTKDAVLDKQIQIAEWIATNEYAAKVYAKGSDGEDIRGTAEGDSYAFIVNGQLQVWENEYYQYKLGLYDEDQFQPRRAAWAMNLKPKGIREVWQVVRNTYSPEFRKEIDDIVAK